jgi:hypothetical protein
VVGAIAALVLASNADREIAASGGTMSGAGMAQAGRIIAILHLALWVLAILVIIVLLFAGVFSGSSNSSATLQGLVR